MIYLDDMHEGDTSILGPIHVTREEALDFARKYDPQPFHLDDAAAAAHPFFKKLSISGWQTCAYAMRLMVDEMQARGIQSPRLAGHRHHTLAETRLSRRRADAAQRNQGDPRLAQPPGNGIGPPQLCVPQPGRHRRHDDGGHRPVRNPPEVAARNSATPPAVRTGMKTNPNAPDMIVAIEHHEARIFHIDIHSHDVSEHTLKPHDPHHFRHHLTHRDQDAEQGQRASEDPAFYEQISQELAGGNQIVIVGPWNRAEQRRAPSGGTPAGEAYRDRAARDRRLRLILSAVTDKQLLALAREKLRG